MLIPILCGVALLYILGVYAFCSILGWALVPSEGPSARVYCFVGQHEVDAGTVSYSDQFGVCCQDCQQKGRA
jgi:hypothetical protein